MKKISQISLVEAAAKVNSGDVLIVGGFGMTGCPVHLLHALAETRVNELTFIGNNVGEAGLGGGRLLRNSQIKKAIGSYFTSNREAVAAAQAGDMEAVLLPQGTLAEAIRAAGAGLGGFYTPTSVGTPLAEGRETRVINGQEMVFIEALHGDVALIRAWRADTAGNLQYRMTENNFNQAAATAAGLVIAEVEEIVPVGEIEPSHIHTPGCFVDYVVQAAVTLTDLGSSASVAASDKKVDERRIAMAKRALQELHAGDIVNLGIGIPTLVADYIDGDDDLTLHTENGMLGVGPAPKQGGALEYPVNAGKVPVTELQGCSYFDSASSFAMIRGGHVDVAIMGGLQVDVKGDLANWAVPGKPLLGVGGAMDLASGAKKLIVLMTHCNKDGSSKVVESCDLPLTAKSVVNTLITDLGVFQFSEQGMRLTDLMPGVTLQDIALKTSASYQVSISNDDQ